MSLKKGWIVFQVLFVLLLVSVLLPSFSYGEQALPAGETAAGFFVENDTAVMTGVINRNTPDVVRKLISEHPEVRIIIMQDVPGSIDDEANLEAARMVRSAGLATHVPSDGEIASGGVDFFLAGVTRTIENDALLGVHSWGGGDVTVVASELPRSHEDHKPYLDFYLEMGIPTDFYWFTLEAAPAESVHWMTTDEIARYGMVTD